MKALILTLIILLICSCSIQGQRCDSLILNKHLRHSLKINEPTLEQFLIKKGIEKDKISNRNNLKSLRKIVCNQKNVLIYDQIGNNKIEVYIEKGAIKFDPLDYVIYGIDSTTFLFYSYEDAPYGFVATDTIVNTISNLSIKIGGKKINIPSVLYEDLFFSNFCNTEVSIKPIEAYLSKDEKYVYLYIFGEHRALNKMTYNTAFQYSYMAKLIIDIENQKCQNRIILRGHELCYYNWGECFDFIGF
jgi:hypothetical protein